MEGHASLRDATSVPEVYHAVAADRTAKAARCQDSDRFGLLCAQAVSHQRKNIETFSLVLKFLCELNILAVNAKLFKSDPEPRILDENPNSVFQKYLSTMTMTNWKPVDAIKCCNFDLPAQIAHACLWGPNFANSVWVFFSIFGLAADSFCLRP